MIPIDEEEFLELWHQHKDRLLARIRKLAHSAPAEDLLQDAFVKVYPKAEKLDADYAPRYLMRTASNLARDYLRRQKNLDDPVEQLSVQETPFDQHASSEFRELYDREVESAVRSLPSPKLEAIRSYLSEEFRNSTARRIGIPSTTLRSREVAALEDLRDKLNYKTITDLLAYYR